MEAASRQKRIDLSRLVGALATLACAAIGFAAGAFAASPEDEGKANDLVVLIDARAGTGAGIVVAMEGASIYVATAYHVIEEGVRSVEFSFWRTPLKQVEVVLRAVETDLAVLRITLEQPEAQAVAKRRIRLDRLGSASRLSRGDVVHPIGHPSRQWYSPLPAPRFEAVEGAQMRIHYSCTPGNSGGGVFDESWNLVGMMIVDEGIFCHAVTAETMRQTIEGGARLPFQLSRAKPPGPKDSPGVGSMSSISGEWTFAIQMIGGLNSSGKRLRKQIGYEAIADLQQDGGHLEGYLSAPPSITCGSGRLEGSLDGAAVEWTLHCEGTCQGETERFNGAIEGDGAASKIVGRMQPGGRPTVSSCLLGVLDLTGSRP